MRRIRHNTHHTSVSPASFLLQLLTLTSRSKEHAILDIQAESFSFRHACPCPLISATSKLLPHFHHDLHHIHTATHAARPGIRHVSRLPQFGACALIGQARYLQIHELRMRRAV